MAKTNEKQKQIPGLEEMAVISHPRRHSSPKCSMLLTIALTIILLFSEMCDDDHCKTVVGKKRPMDFYRERKRRLRRLVLSPSLLFDVA